MLCAWLARRRPLRRTSLGGGVDRVKSHALFAMAAILCVAAVLGCSPKPLTLAALEPSLGSLPAGPANPVAEPVWGAVLRWYHRHPEPTEGDITNEANAVTGIGPGGRAPTALLLRLGPTPPPYSRQWIRDLVRDGVLEGLCAARRPEDCRERQVVTYLILSDPTIAADSASVSVEERAVNPSSCGHGGMGGYTDAIFHLVREGGSWSVLRRERGMAGTIVC